MRQPIDTVHRLIEQGAATIGVIGLGYVGLPLAHAYVEAGFDVIGFDTDSGKVELLDRGEAYIAHLATETAELHASQRFTATSDMGRLHEADAVIVCVPTPLGRHRDPDLRAVENAARAIGRSLRAGQLAILQSTTYPGTTRDVFLTAMLDACPNNDLRVGRDIFVAFSPEREDPGRDIRSSEVPKLVGGIDEPSRELAKLLLEQAFDNVIAVERAEVAEAAKLLENIFRAVNIALVNEMKTVLTDLDIDIWDVIDAASTKPFGFMPFTPGPGLGGHCIPIDPFYLTWKAREADQSVELIELAGHINTRMPKYVVDRLLRALNQRGKTLAGARVLMVGLAYKPNVADTRESPSLELIRLIEELGGVVDYTDPHVPSWNGSVSVPVDEYTVSNCDVVVISTAHDLIDYGVIAKSAPLVVDTRNVMAPYAKDLGDRLVKA